MLFTLKFRDRQLFFKWPENPGNLKSKDTIENYHGFQVFPKENRRTSTGNALGDTDSGVDIQVLIPIWGWLPKY